MNYVLVTKYQSHWDNVPNNRTSYNINLIPDRSFLNSLENGVSTFFIKINNDGSKDIWKGIVDKIEVIGTEIFFNVVISAKIHGIDSLNSFNKIGWYVANIENFEKIKPTEEVAIEKSDYLPPFIEKALKTSSYREFERSVHNIIKLLGINDIYEFDPNRQAGMADGFFILNNFVVIYDVTLEDKYLDKKKQQIINYINSLKEGVIKYYESNSFNVNTFSKEVWIITRGNTKLIRLQDNIKIKEVSVNSLIQLYLSRMKNQINTERLLELLRNIALK